MHDDPSAMPNIAVDEKVGMNGGRVADQRSDQYLGDGMHPIRSPSQDLGLANNSRIAVLNLRSYPHAPLDSIVVEPARSGCEGI